MNVDNNYWIYECTPAVDDDDDSTAANELDAVADSDEELCCNLYFIDNWLCFINNLYQLLSTDVYYQFIVNIYFIDN